MKIVLRHTETRRYYQAPGQWVRRADNALAFEDFGAALQFSEANGLAKTLPVQRLAPYLMPLLRERRTSIWETWTRERTGDWVSERLAKFLRN